MRLGSARLWNQAVTLRQLPCSELQCREVCYSCCKLEQRASIAGLRTAAQLAKHPHHSVRRSMYKVPPAHLPTGNSTRKPFKRRFRSLTLLGWFAVLPLAHAAGLLGNIPLPVVPDVLRVSSGEEPALVTRATGVQNYECRAKKDDPNKFEWVFTGPEADLFDSKGNKMGRHYSGPTWEWNDGSRVVGSVKGSVPAQEAGAIPWLLLAAKDHVGNGVLSRVTSIQRLETSGGKAPASECSAADLGKKLRVPYTAVYRFYVPKA
jgi:hypothetical protein